MNPLYLDDYEKGFGVISDDEYDKWNVMIKYDKII